MWRLSALALLVLAPGLHAETYKWVDERGVVNYSNVPPATQKAKAAPIEDRVSVVPRDPNADAAAAAARDQSARQAEYAHREWLARQQGMQAQAIAAMYAPPTDDVPVYGYGYGYGYGVPVVRRAVRAPVRRVVVHPSPRRL